MDFVRLALTYFRKRLPFIFGIVWQSTPLFADDLGYGRIWQAWIRSNHRCLLVLTVENES
jgi:hypothetical protein